MKEIILASQSPRRKELLERIGIAFDVQAADVDETIDESKPLEQEIMRLSLKKAEAILKDHKDAIVIGSDTVVAIDNEVLGKPKTHQDAKRMLKELSGNTHQVITGIAVISNTFKEVDVSVSNVTFDSLTEEEIDDYINSGEADDKAGAYGIQGKAGCYINNIDGDYYAIMGFPINKVYKMLKKHNLV